MKTSTGILDTVLVLVAAVLVSCGGGGTSSVNNNISNQLQPLVISNSPPAGTVGTAYSGFTFVATGGTPPFTWSETGALPIGIAISSSGQLSGTPIAAGSFSITVTVKDSSSPQQSASGTFTITINSPPPALGFSATGSMLSSRQSHTATALNTGKVLVAGGVDNSKSTLASAELFDLRSGSFAATGSLTTARSGHTATLLKDGRVLVVGGLDNGQSTLASVELFDPGSGSFTATGSMIAARSGHTATLLNDGRVLVVGGLASPAVSLNTAEVFDPTTGTFMSTGNMTTARAEHTATLLSDGKVLVTGGNTQASAELFDPGSGSFTPTGSMSIGRSGHTATLLTNGKVLVTGGIATAGSSLNTAELFDETLGRFTQTGSMGNARSGHTATLLQDGTVLIAGGDQFTLFACGNNCETLVPESIATAELFDPTTGTFKTTTSMVKARGGHIATLLGDGRVLVTGGVNSFIQGRQLVSTVLSTAELFLASSTKLYTLTGYCWGGVAGTDLCSQAQDLTQCPVGQPAIIPVEVSGCLPGLFPQLLDDSTSCKARNSSGLPITGSCVAALPPGSGSNTAASGHR